MHDAPRPHGNTSRLASAYKTPSLPTAGHLISLDFDLLHVSISDNDRPLFYFEPSDDVFEEARLFSDAMERAKQHVSKARWEMQQ